jgi:formylglycine-generating enzyme required for sulfatase activity
MRGGSWDYSPLAAKATYRMPFMATAGGQSTGFRCARDAD